MNNSLSGSLAAMQSTAEPCPLNITILLSLCSVHALAVLSADPAVTVKSCLSLKIVHRAIYYQLLKVLCAALMKT